jgi:DNA-binding transcriptional MerR regulator
MILAEASWEDQAAGAQAARAWIENKSVGGACVRLKTPINVGSRLTVQGRWEQITGVTKYCRRTGKEYLVGIQRDPAVNFVADQPDLVSVPPREQPREARKIVDERKPMQRKWSELVYRHNKQDEGNGDAGKAENAMLPTALAAATAHEVSVEVGAAFHIELLSPEDVYRTAGIMNLRRGFSVSKVAEILHSDRARSMPEEAKQAAVLMALDAAGVEVDEVLQDAKTRQQALNAYETELRKEVEAEWAQKAEENVQIQGELERAKAHYMGRISRNLEGVARQKAAFDRWLNLKQEESQRIAKAAELCVKSPEPAGPSFSAVDMAPVGRKPM